MSEGTATEGAPTGRLFRSLRAEGDTANAAVPALTIDQAVGLRTVSLGDSTFGAPAVAPAAPLVTPSPAEDVFLDDGPPVGAASGAVSAGSAASIADAGAAPVAVAGAVPVAGAEAASVAGASPAGGEAASGIGAGTTYAGGVGGRRGAHAAPGIRASGVWLVVIGVTVLVAFADVIVVGAVNWITGLALMAASVYGAFMVRMADWPIAVIAPPLAMFLAVVTAGQLTLGPITDLLVNEALMIVITLGNNVLWIFGATVAALVIVLLRRSRSRST